MTQLVVAFLKRAIIFLGLGMLVGCALTEDNPDTLPIPSSVAAGRADGTEISARALQDIQILWANELVKAIRSAWLRPPYEGMPENFRCSIKILLGPSGIVEAASIVDSCGNEMLDLSMKVAVAKASPLPLPSDSRAFVSNVIVTFCPNQQSCQ